jgi:hypothetical protein
MEVQSNCTCFQIKFELLAYVGSWTEKKWLDCRMEAVFRTRGQITAFPIHGLLDAVQVWV